MSKISEATVVQLWGLKLISLVNFKYSRKVLVELIKFLLSCMRLILENEVSDENVTIGSILIVNSGEFFGNLLIQSGS